MKTNKVTTTTIAIWLAHWYTYIEDHTPHKFEIDPRLEILNKLHPKTLLIMGELLQKFVENETYIYKAHKYGLDQEAFNEAVYLVAYFWPFKNCVWASLAYFEQEDSDNFDEMVKCFTILTGDKEGGKYFAHLLQNSMSVIVLIPAPHY